MKEKRIAVLGPIPRDHITTHHGEVIEKYGCAMHPTIALARLLEGMGTVIPVSHVRKEDSSRIKEILDAYPNIDQSHITDANNQGDVIRLQFLDQNNRIEQQTGFMDPITPEDVEGLMDCDVFVCIPITDYEVPLQTLAHIRAHSDATIIFDAHGPTNTVDTEGKRHLRYWLDRDLWLPYIDILKMNMEESFCTWYEERDHSLKLGHFSDDGAAHLPTLAAHVLSHGVKALIVTQDEHGGVLFYKEGSAVVEERFKAIRVENVIDTTGCGDSFAGGLGFGVLIDPDDLKLAIRYANALGAQRTQGRSFEVFKNRSETDKIILDFYGVH
ncbi:MAG: carbohydrate kinase family protein [Flavobacteriales bacterium]|nr:carbohydrate kinase family protein [Flavobacteriales bacterium]